MSELLLLHILNHFFIAATGQQNLNSKTSTNSPLVFFVFVKGRKIRISLSKNFTFFQHRVVKGSKDEVEGANNSPILAEVKKAKLAAVHISCFEFSDHVLLAILFPRNNRMSSVKVSLVLLVLTIDSVFSAPLIMSEMILSSKKLQGAEVYKLFTKFKAEGYDFTEAALRLAHLIHQVTYALTVLISDGRSYDRLCDIQNLQKPFHMLPYLAQVDLAKEQAMRLIESE